MHHFTVRKDLAILYFNRKSILLATPLAEPRNTFIVCHQRTWELDCGSDEETISRVAVLDKREAITGLSLCRFRRQGQHRESGPPNRHHREPEQNPYVRQTVMSLERFSPTNTAWREPQLRFCCRVSSCVRPPRSGRPRLDD